MFKQIKINYTILKLILIPLKNKIKYILDDWGPKCHEPSIIYSAVK